MLTRVGILLMRLIGRLPLSWVRALGCLFGYLLFGLAASRRHVVRVNLRLCFPALSEADRRRMTRRTFVHFAQAWLDRGWLWHADAATLQRRLRLKGEVCGDLHQPVQCRDRRLDIGWTATCGRGQALRTCRWTQACGPGLTLRCAAIPPPGHELRTRGFPFCAVLWGCCRHGTEPVAICQTGARTSHACVNSHDDAGL